MSDSWLQRPGLWYDEDEKLWKCARGGRHGEGKVYASESRKGAFSAWWYHEGTRR